MNNFSHSQQQLVLEKVYKRMEAAFHLNAAFNNRYKKMLLFRLQLTLARNEDRLV